MCKGATHRPERITSWLAAWNRELEAGAPPPARLLTDDLRAEDPGFADYLYTRHNQIAERQIAELERVTRQLERCTSRPTGPRDEERLRRECFAAWRLPLPERRQRPQRRSRSPYRRRSRSPYRDRRRSELRRRHSPNPRR